LFILSGSLSVDLPHFANELLVLVNHVLSAASLALPQEFWMLHSHSIYSSFEQAYASDSASAQLEQTFATFGASVSLITYQHYVIVGVVPLVKL